MGAAVAGAAAAADAANAAGDTVVAAATPADGTFFLPFLLVTMMDVNSMVEMGENEVWLHGDVNSMVVEITYVCRLLLGRNSK